MQIEKEQPVEIFCVLLTNCGHPSPLARDAVFQMEHNKASGPDGFLVEFYQVFWGVIKEDLLPLFTELHRETLDLYSLNFGIITLIPKVNNVIKIQQYRPICVLNVSFKIFTKVGTNRLNMVAKTVVRPTQTVFMPGRNIMEGVVILPKPSMSFTQKRETVSFSKLILKRHTTK